MIKTACPTGRTIAAFTLSVYVIAMLTGAPLHAEPSCDNTPAQSRHRLLVLSDIEADPDDAQTLVRLLMYANQIDIEGLVATTSTHQRHLVSPSSMVDIIKAYEKVRPNLARHEKGFPKARQLLALVKSGLPVYGMQGVGEGHDSEGSEWIIHQLEKPDPRPLWVSVWGGVNTLAQALYRLKTRKTEQALAALIGKLRVYTISDQDDSGAWLRREFPNLFYIVSPGGYGAATWMGISSVVEGLDNRTVSNRWIADNIQQGHGPLGALYPDVAYSMEGDTPSWLGLIPNGLNMPECPHWGGWGGRYQRYTPARADTDPDGFTGGVPVDAETRPIWTNATDTFTPKVFGAYHRAFKAGERSFTGYRVSLWRWRDAFQNDFAARMDWAIKPYAQANHPPVPQLRHSERLSVESGDTFYLDGRSSYDPDGDSLSFIWFNYPEAGTLADTPVAIQSAENMARVAVKAPEVTQPHQLHFILQLTDKGSPPLTRYRRVRVTVNPAENKNLGAR